MITELIQIWLVILVGAVLQASTGLGAGILIVPMLALINQKLVPAANICGSLALSFLMAYKGKHDVQNKYLKSIMLAIFLCSILAAVTLTNLPKDKLGVVFGLLILISVFVSVLRINVTFTRGYSVLSGALAGFSGTLVGIGAPFLALLYQDHNPKTVRATLGFIYFTSSILVLIILRIAGYFGWYEMMYGIMMMPVYILGYYLSAPIASRINQEHSRVAILSISALSALALIVKSSL